MAERQLAFSIKVLGSDKQATEIGKIEAELSELSNQRRELNRQLKETVKVEGRNSKSAKQLGTALANVKNQTTQLRGEQRRLLKENNAVSGSYNALSSRMGLLRSRMKDLNLETEEGVREYRRLEKEVLGLNNRLKSLDARVGNSQRNVGNYKSALGGLTNFLKTSVGPAIVGAFAVGSVVAFTKQVVRLNAEMSDLLANVRKTTGLTQVEVEKLADQLERLDTRTSIQGLLKIAEGAGRLGIAQEELAGFVEVVDRAVVALGDDLGGDADQIATDLGKIAGVFGEDERLGTAEALNRIGSAINELGATSRAQAGAIVEITSRLQGFAATADVGVQDILGLSAAMDSLGIRSETGATAVGQFLVALGQDIPKFAELAGLSVDEFSTILEENAVEAMLLVLENSRGAAGGLEGLGQQLEALGVEGARQGQTLTSLAQNTNEVRRQLKTANDEYERGTSLTDEFNIKNDNLAASMEKLDKEFVKIQTSSKGLGRALKGLFDFITQSLRGWDQIFTNIQNEGFFSTLFDFAKEVDPALNRFFGATFRQTAEQATAAAQQLNKVPLLEIAQNVDEFREKYVRFLEAQGVATEKANELFLQYLKRRRELRNQTEDDVETTKELTQSQITLIDEFSKANNVTAEYTKQQLLLAQAWKEQNKSREEALARIRELEEDFARSQLSDTQRQIAEINKRYDEEISRAEQLGAKKEDIDRLEELRVKEIAEVRKQAAEDYRKELLDVEKFAKRVNATNEDLIQEFGQLTTRLSGLSEGTTEYVQTLAELEKVYSEIEKRDIDLTPEIEELEKATVLTEEQLRQAQRDARKALGGTTTGEDGEAAEGDMRERLRDAAINSAQSISDAIIQIKQQQAQRELMLQKRKLEDEKETELSALETRFQQGLITEEQYKKQRDKLNQEFQQRELEIEKQNFEKQKKISIQEAIINAALAATKTLANLGFPAALPALGGLAFATGAQIAIIENQEFPEAEKGAMFEIGGKRHANGGTKFVGSDGSAFEAEQGELLAIVNRRSTDMLKGLSDINVAGGGKQFFQQGGLMPPSPVNLNNSISVPEMKPQKIYVTQTDIERTLRKVKVIEQNASI